ncbi:MAG: hypothetical protein ABI905_09655 [Betaproteobacteria bacterium]
MSKTGHAAANFLKTDWFRDKCQDCTLWTIFGLSLRSGEVFAGCTRCGEQQPFAPTLTEARATAYRINHKVAELEMEYPQLAQLRRLGAGVALPWFVSRDDEALAAVAPFRLPPPHLVRDATVTT